MAYKLAMIFAAVFIAELGDKTQLATLSLATKGEFPSWVLMVVASSALVASTVLAVVVGRALGDKLESWPMSLIAGILFIALGVLSIVEHVRGV